MAAAAGGGLGGRIPCRLVALSPALAPASELAAQAGAALRWTGSGFAPVVDGALRCLGLMLIPPAEGPERTRPFFAALRELAARGAGGRPHVELRELSMGMSGDYEVAIAEGATMVRVGTAIFGERPL